MSNQPNISDVFARGWEAAFMSDEVCLIRGERDGALDEIRRLERRIRSSRSMSEYWTVKNEISRLRAYARDKYLEIDCKIVEILERECADAACVKSIDGENRGQVAPTNNNLR